MTRKFLLLLILLVSSCKTPTKPAITTPVSLSADPSVSLGVPVSNARTWSSSLAPNARGGWNYITCAWEFTDAAHLPEWAIVDLSTGATTIIEGVQKVFPKEIQISAQVRAANGRIFYPEIANRVAYYDPADERVHELPQIVDPVDNNNKTGSIYSVSFGPDRMLYLGTQVDGLGLPGIFQLDPVTLQVRVLGHVGQNRLSYSYAYALRADPPWVYVTVGETPWELAALNITTGEMRILMTRGGTAPWMKLNTDTKGVYATIYTDFNLPTESTESYYLADGAMFPYPYVSGTFTTRSVTPYSNPIVKSPRIDDSNGAGFLRWQPYGIAITGPWNETHYTIDNAIPVLIDSIAALPDNTLMGDSAQYNGFWRFNPATNVFTWYGVSSGLLSQTISTSLNGFEYFTGYPNGGLYAFDYSKPWAMKVTNVGGVKPVNPAKVGEYFTDSRQKYARDMITTHGRVYSAGLRERDGQGAGVGYYDPTTSTFGGNFTNLNFESPQGLADVAGHIVLSGKVMADPAYPNQTPTSASLVLYDYDLVETGRVVVKDQLTDDGQLFRVSDSTVMGVSTYANAAYLYDVGASTLGPWADLGAKPVAATQRPSDGSIWIELGNVLTRVDPVTLERTPITTLNKSASQMTWLGADLYLVTGAELRVIHGL